ncbi:MAG: hypothetical protein U0935_25255 [Pirellulales bacterium]
MLVRQRIDVEPLPLPTERLLVIGQPAREQFLHVSQSTMVAPRPLSQMHLRVVEVLLRDFRRPVRAILLLNRQLFGLLGRRLRLLGELSLLLALLGQ